jgi:hypothetical protein
VTDVDVDREANALLIVMVAFDHQVRVVEVRREVMERCLQLVQGKRRPPALDPTPAAALFG